jgi:hypothetical protein
VEEVSCQYLVASTQEKRSQEVSSEYRVPITEGTCQSEERVQIQIPHFWQNRPEVGHPGSIFACVDPNEKWWARLRGNPKRSGEISQAAF